MLVRRLLFILFLLGVWVQSANACQESLASHDQGHAVTGVIVPVIAGDFAVIGGEQHCECPAVLQSAESVVSEPGKSLLAFIGANAGAALHRAGEDPLLPVENVRAESYLARRATQPHSLPVSRLRQ